MLINSTRKLVRLIMAASLLMFTTALHAETLLEIQLGHSRTLTAREDVVTAAFGNPAIASSVVVKPNTLLINAKQPGSTSLTLFGRSGAVEQYRILVSHDLSMLRAHLAKLDRGIRVDTDPNGNGVILSGVVATKAMIGAAELAAQRFFAEADVTIKRTPNEILDSDALNAANQRQPRAETDPGTRFEQEFTLQETLRSRPATRVINLLMTAESLLPPAMQLESLLKRVDQRIEVELVSDVFLLKGRVETPAALARALGIADRFVSQEVMTDIKVVSDYGGVLAGDLTEEFEEGVDVVDPNLIVQIPGARGRSGVGSGAGGSANQNGSGRGRRGGILNQPLQEPKGNLAQNISRGDVLLAAAGKVMSLLQVDDQPRVEIQMRIMSVDRNKTDKLGIDWTLDGDKVTIGNTTSNAQGNSNLSISLNPGFLPGTYTLASFLKAIETRGAATMLSEPLLTAVSGESSSFLVGGAIPIPTQSLAAGGPTSNPISITNVAYIQFGLKLIVRPTVLENGKIAIVLDQTMSEPDYSTENKVTILNVPIPSFAQKTVSTVTEARDGETWAVAGLITEEAQKSLRKVPFLSEIPILGALFRNKEDGSARNELMITITARRVGGEGTKLFQPLDMNTDEPAAAAKPAPVSTPPLSLLDRDQSIALKVQGSKFFGLEAFEADVSDRSRAVLPDEDAHGSESYLNSSWLFQSQVQA